MSTPAGAGIAPYQPIQGSVLEPSATVDPHSSAAHDFLATLRTLVTNSGAFRSEADVMRALRTIETYGKRIIKTADQRYVMQDTDTAPVEDVTKRKPPAGAAPAQPFAGLDYNALAQAIIAAQQQQQAAAAKAQLSESPAVHDITDAPSPAAPAPPAS